MVNQEALTNANNNIIFLLCTNNIKLNELIGQIKEMPKDDNINSKVLKFKPGYLVDAIENGKVMIFDEINEVSKSILGRLNILLDKRYNGNKEEFFYLPEDSEKMKTLIHDNFRIICTCKLKNIKKLPLSFINRFDVILLENQIEEINDYQLERLISNLFVSYDRIPERKKGEIFLKKKL